MPTVEVLFKIKPNDNSDGDVITYQEPGVEWTSQECLDFLADTENSRPASFSSLPVAKQNALLKRFRWAAWVLQEDRTIGEISRRQINKNGEIVKRRVNLSVVDATSILEEALTFRAIISAEGMDTTWGRKDQENHGVITVGVAARDLDKLPSRRIDYAATLSTSKVNDLRRKGKRVAPDRTSTRKSKDVIKNKLGRLIR